MQYLDDENEDPNDEFGFEEHMRFSTGSDAYSHRYSEFSGNEDAHALRERHSNRHEVDDDYIYSGGSNYHHNKRMSRTSQYSSGSASHHYDDHRRNSKASSRYNESILEEHQYRQDQGEDEFSGMYSGGSSYHHNKRLSRASQNTESSSHHPHDHRDRKSQSSHYDSRKSRSSHYSTGENSHSSYDHCSHRKDRSKSESNEDDADTIALFGAYGVTGHYFLKFSMEAGYHVRTLVLPGIALDDMEGNDKLTVVTGAFDDENKVRRVIRKASYVVCMLNDCDHTLQNSMPPSNLGFIQRLVPMLRDYPKCKVLLYQASSSAADAKGATPMFSNLAKKMAIRKTKRESLQEQDMIVKYICAQSENDDDSSLKYIITRPSEMLWDRPSRKKLAASKSLPGPFPITNIDLAEFSLNSLKTEKLYNTCPYVVQDGI